MKTHKTCRSCEKELLLTKENFYSNGHTPKGTKKWKPTCKSCESSERKQSTMSVIHEICGKDLNCQLCGYNTCFRALEFHHVDPHTKEYAVSQFMSSRRSANVIRQEIAKCMLVCANCHREIHEGLVLVTEADLQFTE